MNQGYLIASHVCESLTDDQPSLNRCLEALLNANKGRLALEEGNGKLALPLLGAAAEGFKEIPKAILLYGITVSDIAAAYTILSEWGSACKFAREALNIVTKEKILAGTEGNTHMSLAIGLAAQGEIAAAKSEFDKAERIFEALHGVEQQLRALQHNRKIFLGSDRSGDARWWKFWK